MTFGLFDGKKPACFIVALSDKIQMSSYNNKVMLVLTSNCLVICLLIFLHSFSFEDVLFLFLGGDIEGSIC